MRIYISDADVKQIQTTVNECGELWCDAQAWQRRAASCAEEILGGTYGAVLITPPGSPSPLEGSMSGDAEQNASQLLQQYIRGGGPVLVPGADRVAARLSSEGLFCGCMSELLPAQGFYRTDFFARFMRPLGAHDVLTVLSRASSEATTQIALFRGPSDRAFSDRERSVLSVLTESIGGLVERRLSTSRHRGEHGLPRRQRQVLAALLRGDSEKQVADGLGLARPSVHEHVSTLYRHFGVHSRGELMAYFVERRPRLARPSKWRRHNPSL